METTTRRRILQGYRNRREETNISPVGEATGRTYLPVPDALAEAGGQEQGVPGFVKAFAAMLAHSPVEVRKGELLVGDYYYLLPYEIIRLEPPVDLGALARRGALPVVPSGHTAVNVKRGPALG